MENRRSTRADWEGPDLGGGADLGRGLTGGGGLTRPHSKLTIELLMMPAIYLTMPQCSKHYMTRKVVIMAENKFKRVH